MRCIRCLAAVAVLCAAVWRMTPDPVGSQEAPAPVPAAPAAEPHRSPTDLAMSPDGRFLLTANHTSDTATLIDAKAGKVLAELPVGKRPFAAAVSRDGRRGLISNTRSNSVSLIEWAADGAGARVVREIPAGPEPRGVAFSADGKSAFAACTITDTVVLIDLAAGTVTKRVEVGSRPWHLALSPDGTKLAVANSRSADLWFLDAGTLDVVRKVRSTGENLRRVAWSPDGKWAHVPHLNCRGFPTVVGQIGRGWVIANHLARFPLEKGGRQAIALDVNGKAVGDADGVALSPDGQWIAVAAGGTHELILLKAGEIPWIEFGGPDDFIDNKLLQAGRFRGVPLGGRPLGVAFSPDSATVYVSNYFGNAVQIVDVAAGRKTADIPLGGPTDVSPERRGETLFADATLSHHQWYSCHSCHTYGHTSGILFDTFNDKRYGSGKRTLSLRGVADTGPWTWHGWRGDLVESAGASVIESMQGKPISKSDAEAVVAYLRTLDFPANPHRNADGTFTDAAKRGRDVYRGEKAGCAKCHGGENLTDGLTHNVGTGESADAFRGYNPPSLRGVFDHAPYLHDGRAKNLESLLTKHHAPENIVKKGKLSESEMKDLIEYLKQL